MKNWPSVAELMERYKVACNLKQTIDPDRICAAVADWNAQISEQRLPIRIARKQKEVLEIATAARAARDAWAARDARAARDAWAARDARDAWAAWDAWAARDARAAWAARAARDARDAWAARDARAASWELTWLAPIVIGARERDDRSTFDKWFPIFLAIEAGAFAMWITDKEIVIAERPAIVMVDDQRRLHAEAGPAFDWLDVQDFYWRGVRVPEVVVTAPEKITLGMIDKESNLEVKRIMIERYGFERYLLDRGGRRIHHDGHGILWRLDQGGAEPIMLAEVFNPTPEPDGVLTKAEVMARFCRTESGLDVHLHRSMAYVADHPAESRYKRYFLPVHPELRPMRRNRSVPGGVELLTAQEMTCHAAVASTYGKYAREYDPDLRT